MEFQKELFALFLRKSSKKRNYTLESLSSYN